MKKRIMAMLLSVMMVLSLLPISVSAEGEYTITFANLDKSSSTFCTVRIDGMTVNPSYSDGDTLSVPAGTTVEIQGNTSGNTLLEGWQVEPEGAISVPDKRVITFTMPEQDITITTVAREIDPQATVDENGVLTYNAIEGYDSNVHVSLLGKPFIAIKTGTLQASEGKYTYDLQTALQEYEWGGGSVETGKYNVTLYYFKNGDPNNDSRAMIDSAVLYDYTAGNRIALATPENLHWDGYVAKWDAVENAGSYKVSVTQKSPTGWSSTKSITITQPECSLESVYYELNDNYQYEIAVTAMPENGSFKYGQSAESQPIVITYKSSAETPTINVHPTDADTPYTQGDTADALTVEAKVNDGGDLSYQWYSNSVDSNTGGTAIGGATGSSYTPPTDAVGTTWYYCVVTNTNAVSGATAQAVSETARIEVTPTVVFYGITVAGVEVTSENYGDVMGDGKISYFPQTNSLLLRDSMLIDGSATDGAIIADGDLSILVGGEIICKGKVEAGGDLVIGGLLGTNGNLKITTTENNHLCLSSKSGSINIHNVALELMAEDVNTAAMRSNKGNITIEWSEIKAKGPNSGISCDNGTVEIYQSTIYAEGRYGINANYQGSIEIEKSTVTLNGTDAGGAYAKNMTVTESDISVSSDSYPYSLWILDTLKIQNSTFDSQSPQYGLCVGNLIVEDASTGDYTDMTIQCGSRNSIYIYSTAGTGQFKVTPKSGVLMDVLTGNAQDGTDAEPIEGAPFDTEKTLQNTYGGKYFRLKKHVHQATFVPERKATCTEDGNIPYWYCEDCEGYFRDEAMTDKILQQETVVLAGHKMSKMEAKDPTCTEAGHIACWTCPVCNKYFEDENGTTELKMEEVFIQAKGHGDTVVKNAKEATCSAEGYTGDKVCQVCGEVVEAGESIPKLAHLYQDDKCTVCGAIESNSQPTDPVNEESVSPKTQDDQNRSLWIILMLASVGGLAGITISKKKQSN